MKWWMAAHEGDEIRYVPLAHLKKVHRQIAAFGAEKDGVRVGYDNILAARGLPPIFRQRLQPWGVEYFAG